MTTGLVLDVSKDGLIVRGLVRVLEESGEYTDYTAEVTWAEYNALSTDGEKIALLIDAWNAVRNPRVALELAEVLIETWNNTEVTLD